MHGADLRWVLLVLGLAFLAGLAWWELRRPRQARGAGLAPTQSAGAADAVAPRFHGGATVHREPTITLPPIAPRDPLAELPTIELVDESGGALTANREEAIDLTADEAEPIVPLDESAEADPLLEVPLAGLDFEGGSAAEPIVDWPEEGARRIVAVRLVAQGERFAGRAVRQALAAEGFVLGRLSIFHRAGPDGRAVMSAANLLRPGTFDADEIDRQRFGGLNLFTVLPGPLPADQAFDELIATARSLNSRLRGQLQDERGAALTPERAAELREAVGGADGA